MNNALVALTGYSRAGKDEAGKVLIEAGWERRAFGDIIKRQLDPLVRQHLGHSAFTEDDKLKSNIRPVLEYWGEANYDNVMAEFFRDLPPRCVNTRLCRVREAREWRARGGVVVLVQRGKPVPGGRLEMNSPHTEWESRMVRELLNGDAVDVVLVNDGGIDDLRRTMRALFIDRDEPNSLTCLGGRPRVVWCSGVIRALHG